MNKYNINYKHIYKCYNIQYNNFLDKQFKILNNSYINLNYDRIMKPKVYEYMPQIPIFHLYNIKTIPKCIFKIDNKLLNISKCLGYPLI